MTGIQQRVTMGHIGGIFGIKGWSRITAGTEYPDSLLDYPEQPLSKNGRTLNVVPETGESIGDEPQVKSEGINDRNQAFALRGYTVEVPRTKFSPAGEDEYYWTDLVGMIAINKEGITLGTVKNLIKTGANDVLIIQDTDKQILIPFVPNYIETVNHDSRTIMVDWGLNH